MDGMRTTCWYHMNRIIVYGFKRTERITAKFFKRNKIPEQYYIYMSEKYKDSASVRMCDSDNGKTDIILSMYELEEKEIRPY